MVRGSSWRSVFVAPSKPRWRSHDDSALNVSWHRPSGWLDHAAGATQCSIRPEYVAPQPIRPVAVSFLQDVRIPVIALP